MKARLMLCAVSLVTIFSTHLTAQVLVHCGTPGPCLSAKSETEFIPLVETTTIAAHATVVLAQKTLSLQENEMRRVFGRVDITSSYSHLDIEAYTQCFTSNGTALPPKGDSEQNYEAPTTPVGPSYPTPGHLVFYPLMLFRAPATGTYVCQLQVEDNDKNAVQAVATSFQGDNTTWLRVSATNEAGAGWWEGVNCDEDGHPPCNYLHGGSNQDQIYVFDNDGTNNCSCGPNLCSKMNNCWQASNNAAFVDVHDSLMVTDCYGSSSCSGPGNNGQNDQPAMVDSHLEFIQLNAAGGMCHKNLSPDQKLTIGSAPHHYMIYHDLLTVPVDPSCGSKLFQLRIFVQWLSGNPVKIDGYTYTHAFAINSIYGTALPVPSVVGLTESAASTSLAGSGYATGLVSNGLSAAAPGTVISQYPSAGIIELPSSGVNLTLSSGGSIVPKLLTLPRDTAIAEIYAAHLAPNVTSKQNCNSGGTVSQQSPSAGSVVPSGSQVTIVIVCQ